MSDVHGRMETVKRWLGRIGLGLASLAMLILAVGAGYEMLGRRRAAREFPPQGKLVDIGGRRIQLDCRGSGTPTVVFESGLDVGGSLSWSAVHDSIAQSTRACAYSRAGIMWSDAHDGPQTGKTVVEDLHATLRYAGERAPFVLVAHSLGGPYAMTYTKYFGGDVAGLVLVDASHPDQVARFREVTPVTLGQGTRVYRVASALSWTGLVRAMSASEREPNEPEAASRATAAYTSTSLAAMVKESDGFDLTLAEAGTIRQLGARPVFVLTAAKPQSPATLAAMKMTAAQGKRHVELWDQMQDEEAAWSSRSQHWRIPDASHYIQFDRPDVVIEAVRSVVDSVRQLRTP
jgi:pimeloyl-ACP methyl ester carboxylesterase